MDRQSIISIIGFAAMILVSTIGEGVLSAINDKRKSRKQKLSSGTSSSAEESLTVPKTRVKAKAVPKPKSSEATLAQHATAPGTVAEPQLFHEGERVTRDESTHAASTDKDRQRAVEQLRRAVVWSEILKPKF